ncbi:MAG TPA: response regulator, partial [Candidatus Acidoferrales bacterium]
MKVLIAEDDPISRVLLSRLLVKAGYEVVATANGSEAWEVLRKEGAPRVAVLDWMMPGMDGLAVCQHVRMRTGRAYTYILLLTSKDATPDVVEGFESGADDYLTKPLNPEELKARLRAGLRILRLEDELVAAREEMQVKATHDALTGLWNRSAILDMLQRDIARARREGGSVGVLLCDIDHFKSINDTHEHAVGDEVLQEAARRFVSSVRDY